MEQTAASTRNVGAELTLNRIRYIREQVLAMSSGTAAQQLPSMFQSGHSFLRDLQSTAEIQRKHKQVLEYNAGVPANLQLALQNCFLVMTAVTGVQALGVMIHTSAPMAARVALDFGSGRMELVPRDQNGVEMGEAPLMFEALGMILGTFGYEAFPNASGPDNMRRFLDGISAGYSGHIFAMRQYESLRERVPRIIN